MGALSSFSLVQPGTQPEDLVDTRWVLTWKEVGDLEGGCGHASVDTRWWTWKEVGGEKTVKARLVAE